MGLIQGQAPTMQVGGRIFTDLANLIQLTAPFNGAAGGNSVLRLFGDGAGRVVTAAKTFKVRAIRINCITAGVFYYGYADADIGIAVNTAFTNPVSIASAAAHSIVASTNVELAVNYDVPAGKYLIGCNAGSAFVGTFQVWGYEE